mmetsp:Transcript_90585/g.290378  ORF Transcript_90585/g.290378 Transcript_90585/m.290378 type:complete len:231 (+) Transcript_90585:101-793(+)
MPCREQALASSLGPRSNFVVQFKKTQVCRFYPRCAKGDACPFAHTDGELRHAPNFTKSKLCAGWADGRCTLQAHQCRFAHGPEDFDAVPTKQPFVAQLSAKHPVPVLSLSSVVSTSSTKYSLSMLPMRSAATSTQPSDSDDEWLSDQSRPESVRLSTTPTAAATTLPTPALPMYFAADVAEMPDESTQHVMRFWLAGINAGTPMASAHDRPSTDELVEALKSAEPEVYED